jgi:hypothetical protein
MDLFGFYPPFAHVIDLEAFGWIFLIKVIKGMYLSFNNDSFVFGYYLLVFSVTHGGGGRHDAVSVDAVQLGVPSFCSRARGLVPGCAVGC